MCGRNDDPSTYDEDFRSESSYGGDIPRYLGDTDNPETMVRVSTYVGNMRLDMTCGACPEQYDVYDENNEEIGYLRLRHGYFAAYLNVGDDEPVYSANTIGDGVFDPSEREYHLMRAKVAIAEHRAR